MLDAYEKLEDIGKGKLTFRHSTKPTSILFHQYLNRSVSGSFGYVSKIRRISDGRILVWKELDYGKMNEKEKQ